MDSENRTIAIIVPCYNEQDNIFRFVEEIDKHLQNIGYDYEYIFVDDGSTDKTYGAIMELSKKRNDISSVRLSRNFGKEAALAVGIKYCESDAAIVIDSDLQHPPTLIPQLVEEWENGADIVDGIKVRRQEENFLKKLTALTFNKLITTLTGMDYVGSSDFKLLDKKAIEILNTIGEKNRFFRGLTNWVGLNHARIEFRVANRVYGKTKWNWVRLIRLSIDAVTSYSSKPLHIITVLGLFTLVFSVGLGAHTLYVKLFGTAVSGFTTVILIVLILSSIIMISIGIIGAYLSRIYDEVKNRPIFIIETLRLRSKTAKTD